MRRQLKNLFLTSNFTGLCSDSMSRRIKRRRRPIATFSEYCISFQYDNCPPSLTCLLGETWSGELGSSGAHPGDMLSSCRDDLQLPGLTLDTRYTHNYVHN